LVATRCPPALSGLSQATERATVALSSTAVLSGAYYASDFLAIRLHEEGGHIGWDRWESVLTGESKGVAIGPTAWLVSEQAFDLPPDLIARPKERKPKGPRPVVLAAKTPRAVEKAKARVIPRKARPTPHITARDLVRR